MDWIHFHLNLKGFFYKGEFLLGVIFLGLAWMLKPKRPDSSFRVLESDLPKEKNPLRNDKDKLAHAKYETKKPLLLDGLRIDQEPHEILGVSENASVQEIQNAYRKLMKIYHPDRIGPPGTQQWNDAQKIAEAINQAKETLIKKLKKN